MAMLLDSTSPAILGMVLDQMVTGQSVSPTESGLAPGPGQDGHHICSQQ